MNNMSAVLRTSLCVSVLVSVVVASPASVMGAEQECVPLASEARDLLGEGCNAAARHWFVYGGLKAVEDACNHAIREQEAQKHEDERLIYPMLQLAAVYGMSKERPAALTLYSRALALRRRLYEPDHPCIKEIRDAIENIRILLATPLAEPTRQRKDEAKK